MNKGKEGRKKRKEARKEEREGLKERKKDGKLLWFYSLTGDCSAGMDAGPPPAPLS